MTMILPGTTSEAEQQFQEKMKERLRAAMGDLMPDEVLAGIVARGIDEAFFKKRKRPRAYGYGEDEIDSWVVEHIGKTVEVEVRAQIEKWIASNSEKVAEIVEKTLQGGIAAAVVRSMDKTFYDVFSKFSFEIEEKLNEIRRLRT